jgi:hypothetical protein
VETWSKGRSHIESYNELDELDDEDEAQSSGEEWEGEDEMEDVADEDEEGNEDDGATSEDELLEAKSHIVVLRYGPGRLQKLPERPNPSPQKPSARPAQAEETTKPEEVDSPLKKQTTSFQGANGTSAVKAEVPIVSNPAPPPPQKAALPAAFANFRYTAPSTNGAKSETEPNAQAGSNAAVHLPAVSAQSS